MQSIFQSVVDTLSFVPRTLMIMFLSLFVTGFLIELGLFKRLEFVGRPLARLANLPKESAITFVASMGSVLVGNTMLAQFHREEVIDAKQTFLSALLNGIPVYIRETFTYQIPVIIPILGIKVGGIYFLTFLAAGFARLLFVISFGKIALKNSKTNKKSLNPILSDNQARVPKEVGRQAVRRTFREIFTSSFKREIKVFLKISLVFVSMTFIVFLLINNGILSRLKEVVQPLTDFFKLPSSAAIPVSTYMLSPLVGATSIGTMTRNGSLSDFQAIIACMLGGILMLPVFTLRYSLAKYTAIFGFSLGSRILLVSTLLGMLVRVFFLLVFLFMI